MYVSYSVHKNTFLARFPPWWIGKYNGYVPGTREKKKSVGMTCCSVQFQHTTQRQIATDVSSGPRNDARNEIAEPSAWHSSNPGALEAKT